MNFFKKINESEKIQKLIKEYNISEDYLIFNRKSVSKAVFIGFFIAFIPMPMQMFAVFLVAPFIRFNLPIAFALCWITNPITMPFVYYIEYLTGSFLLNMQIEEIEMSITWFTNNFSKIFFQLYYGAFFYSVLFSSLGYFLVNYLWAKSVLNKRKSKVIK